MSNSTVPEVLASDAVLVDTVSTNYTEFNSILYNAIVSGNIKGVSSFVLNSTTIPFFIYKNKYFVELAYSNRQLESAEILISNGAVFDVKSIFLINDFSCSQKNHIDRIRPYMTNIQYNAAINLIDAYGCQNKLDKTVIFNEDICIKIDQYLLNHTISNIKDISPILQYYNSMQNIPSNIVSEVMKGIIGLSYEMYSPFIIMPIGTRTYFDAANIGRSNQSGFVYLPVNNYDREELSFTLHEFTHYLLEGLDGLDGYAYFDVNSKKEYEKAAKATLLNVFTIFRRKIEVEDYKIIVESEKYDSSFVCKLLTDNSIINLFTFLSNPDNELRTTLLMNEYIGNSTIPSLNKKIVLGNFIRSIMEQNSISQDDAYVLARVGEFIKRPGHELSKELIVRLVELETYGINSKTMEIFNPLREYWVSYISPKIQEVIKTLPVSFCKQVKSSVALSDNILDVEAQQNIAMIGDVDALDQEL